MYKMLALMSNVTVELTHLVGISVMTVKNINIPGIIYSYLSTLGGNYIIGKYSPSAYTTVMVMGK